MAKVIVNRDGVEERASGSGVYVDVQGVGRLTFGKYSFYGRRPNKEDVPDGTIPLWPSEDVDGEWVGELGKKKYSLGEVVPVKEPAKKSKPKPKVTKKPAAKTESTAPATAQTSATPKNALVDLNKRSTDTDKL